MWPADDELLSAWRRLLADPDTGGAFAGLVVRPLEADLARRFRRVDPHAVTTAVGVAILAFLKRPDAYDPGRKSLPAYLRLIAHRKLLNVLEAEGRHHRGRIPWEPVEDSAPARNEDVEGGTLADHPGLRAVIESLSEADRVVLDLHLDGERRTAVFAAAMGIADRPAAEQAAEVKRVKDKITARLKRAGASDE
jgi:DNA-directed RNA polymerase specialized sigma24 family protein